MVKKQAESIYQKNYTKGAILISKPFFEHYNIPTRPVESSDVNRIWNHGIMTFCSQSLVDYSAQTMFATI